MSDVHFVKHVPCPGCASKDNASLYSDGHVYCHACRYHCGKGRAEEGKQQSKPVSKDLITEVEYRDIPNRKLTVETCQLYRYGYATVNGRKVHVAEYRDTKGNVCGQKTRDSDKKFVVRGKVDCDVALFGQHLCRDGGKMIVITEGEIDAMSVSQAQGNKWPAVSVPNGSSSANKAIQRNLEWLEKFETVVLMFDNDEPGKTAVEECVELFSPGKVKVATLPLKDANEMLKAGRTKELVDAVWGAKEYRPDGIVAGTDLWDRLINEPKTDSLPFPYAQLNLLTEGARLGEIIMVTSGTGMGKSEFVGQIAYDWLMNHADTLGLLHLEEKTTRSANRMIGLRLSKRVHLNRVRETVDPKEYRKAYEETIGNGRVFLYDHFGSTDDENLFAKIRYLAKGCGCKTIVLDHVSIVVSGMDVEADERRTIDKLMTSLATMAQELNVRIVVISHLKKPDGTSHEEGGRVTLDHLRGSGSLKQLSFTIVALERNQQDPVRKFWTRVRVLKCRHTGQTGHAGWLKYNEQTGWLEEGIPEFDDDETPGPFRDETVEKAGKELQTAGEF